MPYASDAQRRFMHVRHPKIARRWDSEVRSAKKKGTYVKPPERVETVSKQWGANNAVGKAMGDDDRKTLQAGGVSAAGLGALRLGGGLHRRALNAVPAAQATLTARTAQVADAKAARDRAGVARPIGGAAGQRKILKEPGKLKNPLNRRDWIKNLERGQKQAEEHLGHVVAAQPSRIRTAVKIKGVGGLAALGGAAAAVHYGRRAARDRAAAASGLGY